MFGLSDETPILQNLNCSGREYFLSDCPGYALNNVTGEYCLSGMYQAGVLCIQTLTRCYSSGSIQLSDFMYEERDYGFSFVARVDYCYNETLQGVCDVGWTDEDAAVVCREYYGGYCKPEWVFYGTAMSFIFPQ